MYNFAKRPRLDGDDSSGTSESNQLFVSTTVGPSNSIPANLVEEVEMMAVSGSDVKETQTTSICLPFFGIQCDWNDALSMVDGKSWITIRHPDHESIHGTLQRKGSELIGSEPFVVDKNKTWVKHFLTLRDDKTKEECSFIAPVSIYNGIHRKSIVSMDVTEGGLGVSVCSNNELKIWESENGNVRRTLTGHVGDVYTCRFFPSGIVVLTSGADMSLKIWSAETGECPVTLRGHTAAINDTAIVERGRNIISVSKDGTAKLWDCGESKCLTTLVNCGVPITSCSLIAPSSTIDMGQPVSNMSDREIGTQGKLLLLARDDMKIQGIGIGSRKEVFSLGLPSRANKVISNGSNSFLVGCESGEIQLVDLRKVVPFSKSISFSTQTPILDLMCHPRSPSSKPGVDESNRLFWATKSDGTVAIVNPNLNANSRKYVQLTGSDCDPVYQIKHDGNYIFTACRDGLIRKYSIDQVMRLLY